MAQLIVVKVSGFRTKGLDNKKAQKFNRILQDIAVLTYHVLYRASNGFENT